MDRERFMHISIIFFRALDGIKWGFSIFWEDFQYFFQKSWNFSKKSRIIVSVDTMSVRLIEKGGGFRPCEALATPREVWTPRAEGATSCPAYAGIDERGGVS